MVGPSGRTNGLHPPGPTAVRPLLQTADRVLAVLEAFGPATRELGVTQVSRLLGVSGPTAYRLLSTLEVRGFLEQEPHTRRYRLGLKFFQIANQVSTSLTIIDIVRPYLEHLAATTNETAFLSVWDRGGSISLDMVHSPLGFTQPSTLGKWRAPNASSAGKCLLAFQPTAEIEHVLTTPLPASGPRAITDPRVMRREIEHIRARGYALNWAETQDDRIGIAVPVHDRFDRVSAAVGLGVPLSRMSEARIADLVQSLQDAAQAIAVRISASPHSTGNVSPVTLGRGLAPNPPRPAG